MSGSTPGEQETDSSWRQQRAAECEARKRWTAATGGVLSERETEGGEWQHTQ